MMSLCGNYNCNTPGIDKNDLSSAGAMNQSFIFDLDWPTRFWSAICERGERPKHPQYFWRRRNENCMYTFLLCLLTFLSQFLLVFMDGKSSLLFLCFVR